MTAPVTTAPTREPIKVLGDILKTEMFLEDGQIMLGLENWRIPANAGLYVSLFYETDAVIGTGSEFDHVTNVEVQSVAMLHTISIDAMSFDDSARLRKEEIIMALNSNFSSNHLDTHLMAISRLPQSFVPVPELEETKRLNKYRLTFAMNALHQRTKTTSYYDSFPTPEITISSDPTVTP